MPAPSFSQTFRTTTFEESLVGPSPTEAWSIDRGRASRNIDTGWTTRKQAALDFMGYAEVLVANGGNYLSRTIPANYPGESKIWCTDVPKTEGIGPIGYTGTGETMLAEYQMARLALVYSTPPYEIMSDDDMVDAGYVDSNGNPSEGAALAAGYPRYISINASPGMQILTFNRALIKRADTLAPLSEGVPFHVPYLDIEFTWWHVPQAALNWTAWGRTQGRINSDTFYVFEPETLLCEPPKIVPITGPFGDRLFNVVFKMRYKPNFNFDTPPVAKGWNYALMATGNGGTADIDMIRMCVDNDDTVYPFQTADFKPLFEPAQ